ncbi:hypothetical protein L198_08225 [Cryptococcus wingfieldii CBS 7118]|uniref:Uncharacterized protein n=1 Tax=Cryptococcus wingfieldii CBS 7118 TaxID=1295528 RepID=A0A1E3HD87_9TREE|nr:hypothetical protein L198_08225 [Cryptococcus wingfieldii CBS 7118]ODN74294.1 hypothetical protein L198_08225 [Cryptococcus wingfieldii CBS 7118]
MSSLTKIEQQEAVSEEKEEERQHEVNCRTRRTLLLEYRASLKERALMYGVRSTSYRQLVGNYPIVPSPLRQSFIPEESPIVDDEPESDGEEVAVVQKAEATLANTGFKFEDGPGELPFLRSEEDDFPTSWADDEVEDTCFLPSFLTRTTCSLP